MATPPDSETQRLSLLTEFHRNRRLAHEVLFRRRHPIRTPAFHHTIQDAFHSNHPQVVIEGFRDAAKSTVAEEGFVLGGLFEEFKYGVIVGSSHLRAKERLAAIANEFIVNEEVVQLFGSMQGPVWGAEKIILANGVCIQALGAGMSMRGMRYLDDRPDFALIDDLEDEESVKNPQLREDKMTWLLATFMPALKKGPAGTYGYRLRVLGNRLDSDALIVRIAKDPAWVHLQFPIMEQVDDGDERFDLPEGKWRPLWGDKFSLDDIAEKRTQYQRLGKLHTWQCEYMCEADNPESRIFKESDVRNAATVRTWQATYAAYDPARTTNSSSASTGVAVFSWIGSKLVVWRGDARLWLPDEIVDDIISTDREWSPVAIGVEATGLEEFIMQPLRHKSIQRHVLLPVERLIPPKGKDSFIRGLQPFFKSHEVEFVNVTTEARAQLLGYPTGRRDFPNALAYALIMRPGLPVYDISVEHVAEDLVRIPALPWYLVANATTQYTAAALIQIVDGQLRVHADWMREGPPGENLADVYREARLDVGGAVRLVTPPLKPGRSDTIGLGPAVRSLQATARFGGENSRGRAALREMLQRRRRQGSLFVCCHAARWVLNAMAGGYAYPTAPGGQLATETAGNAYRVLMEGIESFCAQLEGIEDNELPRRTRTGEDGRSYTTILPTAESPQPTKDEWEGHDFGLVNTPRTIRIVR